MQKTLDVSPQELLSYRNRSYLNEINDVDREKIFIFKTYYNFINNSSCIEFIENIISIFSDLENKEKSFIVDKDMEITIAIIVLKSYISNNKFSNTYVNSDDALNYCADFFIRYCISKKIFISEKHIRQFFLIIFSELKNKNLITYKKTNIKDIKMYKTIINYNFHTINYVQTEEELFNFCFCELKIIQWDNKLFSHTYHFSRIYEICKKNFWSNKTFKPKNLNYIKNKINIKIYIDDFTKELNNIRDKDILIGELYLLNNELKKKYETDNWTANTKNEIALIQKKISKINEEYALHILAKQNISSYVYFILYIDFRGRKYYDSIIGPTQSKFLRTFFYYGYYEQKDFIGRMPSKTIYTHHETIKKICLTHNWEYEDYFYDAIFWSIIGIGKIARNKEKVSISDKKFIDYAIQYLEDESKFNLNLLDKLEIEHYKKILKNLTKENMMNGKIKKYIVVKDATASVNQIFMKQLGPIDQNSLNYLNLGEENIWYDTYLIYRDKFIEHMVQNDNKTDVDYIKKSLLRKLIKKTIMIIPYSAGFDLCWQHYTDLILEENILLVDKKLKKMYFKFYNFVKKTMQQKYFYKKNTSSYLKKINDSFEQNRMYIIETQTGEADISYFKLKKSSIEKKYTFNNKKRRLTKLQLKLTSALDIKSFNTSSGPNIAHFYDADEIREIELAMNKYFITIHDCYLVDILSCSDLIKTKQEHYNKHIENYKIKNIFILL